ncbi:MAG TPA: hypothetical protein VJL39_00315 [Candidatus Paceibacterota bacterium]
MADIKLLARRAKEKLDSRNALNEADAISKAIKGAGINHPADHRRLMSQVGRQFARDKADATRAAHRRAS